MAAKKKSTASKKSSPKSSAKKAAKKPAGKTSGKKNVAAKKKAAAKKQATPGKAAAKKQAAPKKKVAAKKKASAAKQAAPDKKAVTKKDSMAKKATVAKPPPTPPKREPPSGSVSSMDVSLGHVFSIKPRLNTSYRRDDFHQAKIALKDEVYEDLRSAVIAVAKEALALTRGSANKPQFQKRR
jgi:hypothetical protein